MSFREALEVRLNILKPTKAQVNLDMHIYICSKKITLPKL